MGQAQHIRHDPIDVPDAQNPFTDITIQQVFEKALRQICNAGFLPTGFGVRNDEWEGTAYPEFEALKVGQTKDIMISLPKLVWLSCAVLFTQGLEVLARTLAMAVDHEF